MGKRKQNNITDSLYVKYGAYSGILVAIAAISVWFGIGVPKGYEGIVILLILMGVLIIWIDHTFQRKKP